MVEVRKRMLILGLDASGKTVILYMLKLQEVVSTVPTIGFNVEALNIKGEDYDLWDVGGQVKLRPLWRHYLKDNIALIWVVDANDPDRYRESGEELAKIWKEFDNQDIPLLVFASKSDIVTVDADAVTKGLNLSALPVKRLLVQPCSGITGDGLKEGMEWIVAPSVED